MRPSQARGELPGRGGPPKKEVEGKRTKKGAGWLSKMEGGRSTGAFLESIAAAPLSCASSVICYLGKTTIVLISSHPHVLPQRGPFFCCYHPALAPPFLPMPCLGPKPMKLVFPET